MSAAPVKVLFLDDDAALLELLRELMASYAGDSWSVFGTTEPARALTLLQEHQIDLIVLDVHMPVVDGVQFLKLLHRRHPAILKVVLTGDTTGAFRDACLNSGAELYLEKPRGRSDWQSIHATLAELVRFVPGEDGFRGVLRKVGLQDIIQIECLSRNSSILEVITGNVRGLIYIQNGSIVHADDGAQTGVDAFFRLFAMRGGEFNLKPFTAPPCASIAGFTWEGLLMEAAQARDEVQTETPPPDDAADLAAAQAEGRQAQSEAVEPPMQTRNWADGERRPQVDEIIICSPRGEVLYEWQCKNNSVRLHLLTQLASQASRLGQDLPLGNFDRFEASGPDTRIVVQIQPAHTMYVHTTAVPDLETAVNDQS